MPSSISHSNSSVPWKTLFLLGAALVIWAAGMFYSLRLNPEVRFFRHCAKVKQQWAQQLDRDYPHKIVIFGGSSCNTSVDGERMLNRYSLPVANMGLGAGMGALVLTHFALQFVRPGDTLLVGLEPGLLTEPLELQSLGVQFSCAIGQPELLRNPDRVNWPSTLLDLRPGGYHLFTLLGKMALHEPLYRYTASEIHPSGWHEVGARSDVVSMRESPTDLSPQGRSLLMALRAWCDQRHVRVAYVLPWEYSAPGDMKRFQECNLQFLCGVAEAMPILKDVTLGADTNRNQFADAAFHPTTEGAALRSDELAREIKSWGTWTRDELQERLKVISPGH